MPEIEEITAYKFGHTIYDNKYAAEKAAQECQFNDLVYEFAESLFGTYNDVTNPCAAVNKEAFTSSMRELWRRLPGIKDPLVTLLEKHMPKVPRP